MATTKTQGVNLEGLDQIFKICGKEDGMAALKRRVADHYLEKDKRVVAFLREMEQYDTPKLVGDAASDNNKERMHAQTNRKAKLRDRELMTFRRKSSVTEGHLTMLHSKLTEEGWIDGIEGDFKALFSGVRDEDCTLTWLGKYGNGTLVELFRQLVGEGLVIVPKGYSLPYILEGHFKDQEGKWLTRLDKGDRAHDKALPVIQECVDLLKMNVKQLLQKLRGDMMDEDEDFQSKYDPYDKSLSVHRWK
ncbi:MAG: hypothetical protein IKN58_11785 [Prevotella sp.]|nr:hypothetical protein [Prevotella sp.]